MSRAADLIRVPATARRMADAGMRVTSRQRDVILQLLRLTKVRSLKPTEFKVLAEIVERGLLAPRLLSAVIAMRDERDLKRARGQRDRTAAVLKDVDRTLRKRTGWTRTEVYQDVASRHLRGDLTDNMTWQAVKKLHQRGGATPPN